MSDRRDRRARRALAGLLLAFAVTLAPLLASAGEWQTYLEDDFSAPQSMFYTGQAGEALYSIDDQGRYVVDGLNTGSDSLSSLTDSLYYYYLEAQCELLKTNAGELAFTGLVFHYNKSIPGTLSYYVFYIYGDGYYGAKRVVGDQVDIIIPLTPTDMLDLYGVNVLAVDAQGTTFDLYINGRFVDSFTDVRVDGGGFGFYISKHARAAFDNFKVKVERRGGGREESTPPALSGSNVADEGGVAADGTEYAKYQFPVIPKDPNRPTYSWEVGVDKTRKKPVEQPPAAEPEPEPVSEPEPEPAREEEPGLVVPEQSPVEVIPAREQPAAPPAAEPEAAEPAAPPEPSAEDVWQPAPSGSASLREVSMPPAGEELVEQWPEQPGESEVVVEDHVVNADEPPPVEPAPGGEASEVLPVAQEDSAETPREMPRFAVPEIESPQLPDELHPAQGLRGAGEAPPPVAEDQPEAAAVPEPEPVVEVSAVEPGPEPVAEDDIEPQAPAPAVESMPAEPVPGPPADAVSEQLEVFTALPPAEAAEDDAAAAEATMPEPEMVPEAPPAELSLLPEEPQAAPEEQPEPVAAPVEPAPRPAETEAAPAEPQPETAIEELPLLPSVEPQAEGWLDESAAAPAEPAPELEQPELTLEPADLPEPAVEAPALVVEEPTPEPAAPTPEPDASSWREVADAMRDHGEWGAEDDVVAEYVPPAAREVELDIPVDQPALTEDPAAEPEEAPQTAAQPELSLFPPDESAPSDDATELVPLAEEREGELSFGAVQPGLGDLAIGAAPSAGEDGTLLDELPLEPEPASPPPEPAPAEYYAGAGLEETLDEFNEQRWPVSDGGGASFRYFGAAYEILNLDAQTMAISYQDASLGDCELSIDAEYLDGLGYVGYGMAARLNVIDGAASYYGLFICQTGEFMLLKVHRGTEQVLVDWTPAAGLLPSQSNRIMLDARGDLLTAYINGEQVAQVRDTDIASGGYALLAGPGVAVRFDNLRLRGYPR